MTVYLQTNIQSLIQGKTIVMVPEQQGNKIHARVLEPLLAGSMEAEKILADDVDYVVDLGLITKDKQIRIANRIYREVIPGQLTYSPLSG